MTGNWEDILSITVQVRCRYTGDASGIPADTTVSSATDAYETRERAMMDAIGRVRLCC